MDYNRSVTGLHKATAYSSSINRPRPFLLASIITLTTPHAPNRLIYQEHDRDFKEQHLYRSLHHCMAGNYKLQHRL